MWPGRQPDRPSGAVAGPRPAVHSDAMARSVSTILLAAAFGSVVGTLGWSLLGGGTGSPDPARFVAGFSALAMMFTVPGAALIFALKPMLEENRVPRLVAGAMLILTGGTLGGLILGAPTGSMQWGWIGALYGALTALGLLLVQLLPGFRPKAGPQAGSSSAPKS